MCRRQKRKRRHIWLAVVLIVLLLGALGYFSRIPQTAYILEDYISHIGRGQMPEKAEDIETTASAINALGQDGRVTFDESLALINTEHPITGSYTVSEYQDSGVLMNDCIQSAYQSLAEAVLEGYGQHLYVRSAYRTAEEQQAEIDEVGETAAAVDASEHQAGLALDVYVPQYAGMALLKSEAGRYVNSNCMDFGFIIRYPYYGKGSTGIGYEPWHLRYVGLPHAEIIMENSMTLEEYADWYEPDTLYRYGDYLILHATEDVADIPSAFDSAVISPDNQGGWWLTFR